MTDKEILLDLLQDFAGTLQWTIHDLSPTALGWQPDMEANSIGVTVWHIGRSFDVLTVRVLQNRSYLEEVWQRGGWAAKTGYDPHGIGFGGWGTLARFTHAEVERIPILSAAELLTYFDQTTEAFRTYFVTIPAMMLYQPPAWWPDVSQTAYQPATAYECIRNILMDTREHLGEIKALKAMWQRKFGK
jgi:DinB superfamily